MSHNKIVAIAGTIGSGKDMIGNYLVQNYGYKRMSFATALKDVVAAVFRWDRDLIDGLTEESRIFRETVDEWWTEKLDLGIPITPRWATVNMGTEVMRNHFHPQIWILSLARQIMQYDGPVVLTDARFLNELAFIREQKGLVLGVHRRAPHWLKPFYAGIGSLGLSQDAWSDLDMSVEEERKRLIAVGQFVMHNKIRFTDRVHESEWQHVLWNDYDVVIDNRGSKEHTYKQVDAIIF
jgi:hypothetical protein